MLADGTVEARARSRRRARAARARQGRAASRRSRSSSCTATAIPSTSGRSRAIARELGFAQVSVSHECSPLIKLVGRGDTTVVDAYLSPILARYVRRVATALDAERTGARVMFMMSSGGLTAAELFAGKDAILSGPAGGVVAMARTAASAGFAKAIGFDMGGTSTDVAHFDGSYERAFETEVAGVRMRAPMMKIHTVAAGGGSILHFDGARFRVGPDSAGADPGPKCYRRGGPLAVTDANLMVGKLAPDFFPKIFGPSQDQPLDAEAVSAAFAALAAEIGDGRGAEDVADGFIAVAVAKMAEAIKKISVARGYDVTRYALNCFGGAGGQHACDVADALAIETVLIHPLSSLLSAYGMGLADISAHRSQGVEEPLSDDALARLAPLVARLGDEAAREVESQGVEAAAIKRRAAAHVRYAGSDTSLEIDFAGAAAMRRALREGAQGALRLRRPRQAAGDRGGRGRGDRRRGALRRARRRDRPARAAAGPRGADALLLAWRVARRRRLPARNARARRARRRPGADHRAAPDDRRRGRLGRRDHRQEPCRAAAHEAGGAARGDRRQGRSRSCWRSSTTSSCRSPSRWA